MSGGEYVGESDVLVRQSNLIALPADTKIDMHTSPNLDVLIHVTAGRGQLIVEIGSIDLVPGAVVWLPRGSRRQFVAGPDGLCYLAVHQRRHALVLEPVAGPAAEPVG